MSATVPRAGTSSEENNRPLLRPLARRRTPPLRLKLIDSLWMATVALISATLSVICRVTPHAPGADRAFPVFSAMHASALDPTLGIVSAVGVSILAYVSGLALKDRSTAVIAGLLTASCGMVAAWSSSSPDTLIFTLLISMTIAAYALGWSVPLFLCAALAAAVRPDALLLGVIFAIAMLIRSPRASWPPIVMYLVVIGCAATGWEYGLHQSLLSLVPRTSGTHQIWLFAWATAPPILYLAWFLLPFLGEFSTEAGRARWTPPALWIIVSLVAGSNVAVGGYADTLVPLLPVLYLFIAVGISLLLPTIAGVYPRPALRYLSAILAVAVLLGMRARVEWPMVRTHRALLLQAAEPTPAQPAVANDRPVDSVPVVPPRLPAPVGPMIGAASVAAPLALTHAVPPTARVPSGNASTSNPFTVSNQGVNYHESSRYGGGGGNSAAPPHLQPAQAARAHPQQAVHAALNRAPQAPWGGRGYRYAVLPRGRNRGILRRWVRPRYQTHVYNRGHPVGNGGQRQAGGTVPQR